MAPLTSDWRVFIAIYVLASGIWGVLARTASTRLDPRTASVVGVGTAALVVMFATIGQLRWQSTTGVISAVAAGVLGGVASLALYAALRQAPPSVVLPVGSLYLVVTVVLSYCFLGETVTVRQGLGIACALAAVSLLAR